MRLFLDRKHAAAGSPVTGFPLGAAPKASALCDATPSVRSDLDPTHGLDQVDKSPAEQGTLLLPPSLAIAFPALPCTRTLLTVLRAPTVGCGLCCAEQFFLRFSPCLFRVLACAGDDISRPRTRRAKADAVGAVR